MNELEHKINTKREDIYESQDSVKVSFLFTLHEYYSYHFLSESNYVLLHEHFFFQSVCFITELFISTFLITEVHTFRAHDDDKRSDC